MKNNIFQTIVMVIFAFGAVVGLIFFLKGNGSGSNAVGSGNDKLGKVVMWGTLPDEYIKDTLVKLNDENSINLDIDYIEKDPVSFDQELVEAIADGTAPDVFLLPDDLIVRYQNKVVTIPYDQFPVQTFRSLFIESSEKYLGKEGVIAMPFAVDPLVVYWNRDLFNQAGIATPPKYWDELISVADKISTVDQFANISNSAVALGEFDNINHAKEILTTLILQSGNKIVINRGDGKYSVTLADSGKELSEPPAQSALRFFTEFSNPATTVYSWNRSLEQSQDMFLAGDLGIYFGFSSEILSLRTKNPNLNFDVVPMFQRREGGTAKTFGRMYALAIPKGAKNIQNVVSTVRIMTEPQFSTFFTEASTLPPVRRTLLAEKPKDVPYLSVFFESALISDFFLDPSPNSTDLIFKDMVTSVTSGRSQLSQSVAKANAELGELFDQ